MTTKTYLAAITTPDGLNAVVLSAANGSTLVEVQAAVQAFKDASGSEIQVTLVDVDPAGGATPRGSLLIHSQSVWQST